ncbi:MAG: hypothetical protein COZ85_01810 [Candidatus Moranbacteria bacterium CG_4_8_14_3_um_filter_34_16]|nr:MAG: hypothetical protein COT31_00060 [Candidatus Moranbacteria bacterium CG08_land_8_20_14_0_20_34_16]PIW95091.1 MAG: hypothetical protein COZ85_01810 [Candidatus Moranbacteria bacterium CG_4_8_14_3_um_filter_34_16]
MWNFLKKMIFDALKSILFVSILVAIFFGAMSFLGYEINEQYFSYSKKKCEEDLKKCAQKILEKKEINEHCNFKCLEPKLIVKKKNVSESN